MRDKLSASERDAREKFRPFPLRSARPLVSAGLCRAGAGRKHAIPRPVRAQRQPHSLFLPVYLFSPAPPDTLGGTGPASVPLAGSRRISIYVHLGRQFALAGYGAIRSRLVFPFSSRPVATLAERNNVLADRRGGDEARETRGRPGGRNAGRGLALIECERFNKSRDETASSPGMGPGES